MRTPRRPKIRDRAYEQLQRCIVECQLAPSDRLPTKNQLAETFSRPWLETRGFQPLVAFQDLPHVFFRRFHEGRKRVEWKTGFECRQRIVDAQAAGLVEAAVAELHAHIESHEERIR